MRFCILRRSAGSEILVQSSSGLAELLMALQSPAKLLKTLQCPTRSCLGAAGCPSAMVRVEARLAGREEAGSWSGWGLVDDRQSVEDWRGLECC